ncbi:MAG: Uma2 family endonuclease [Rubrivivax sp.]|nr:Uma2 family endonuclease [Rubrivivax sp.]
MATAPTLPLMSAAEFLAWEETQAEKHEFACGVVYPRGQPPGQPAQQPASNGASKAHVAVSLNVAMALRQHLRGSPCSTFIADTRLRVEAADVYCYPDVMVTCSAADAADPMTVREPVLVVEVLSPSTAAHDRGDKFATCRLLPSLREYVLIDPVTRRSDVFRKGKGEGECGLWVLHPFEPAQGLQLASVALDVAADVLWEQVPVTGTHAVADTPHAGPQV